MISFRDFIQAFRQVGLSTEQPVIVHAALSSTGEIRGGAETALGALLSISRGILAPTFTYKTMIVPEIGPEHNAMNYGAGKDTNRMAEFFRPDMPADPLMGILPEAVRRHPNARRSSHPILSFAGINVDDAIEAQTIEEPFAPIGVLAAQGGMVLLIGVDHTVNTSIHYAERLAGRKQFVRWALTPQGVRECPRFSGCSDGFEQAAGDLASITRTAQIGSATIRAVQLAPMIEIITALIQRDPLALLCSGGDERCAEVRRSVLAVDEPAAGETAALMEAEVDVLTLPALEEDKTPAGEIAEEPVDVIDQSASVDDHQAVETPCAAHESPPEDDWLPSAETASAETAVEEHPLVENEILEGRQAADENFLFSSDARKTRPLPELHGNNDSEGDLSTA